jgi:hypothetical protein
MSKPYTDEDKRIASAAAHKCLADYDTVMNARAEARYVADEVLSATAPAIIRRAKAEALREFADATSDLYPLDVWPDPNKFHDSVDRRSARMARLVAAQARARAEEIEAGE